MKISKNDIKDFIKLVKKERLEEITRERQLQERMIDAGGLQPRDYVDRTKKDFFEKTADFLGSPALGKKEVEERLLNMYHSLDELEAHLRNIDNVSANMARELKMHALENLDAYRKYSSGSGYIGHVPPGHTGDL